MDKQKQYRAYLLPYARQDNEWQEVAEKYRLSFQDEQVQLSSVLLPSPQSVDDRQLAAADILVIPGGDTQRLLKHSNARLEERIGQFAAQKLVIASSAGVNMLARWYYRHDDKTFVRGCGIIPVAVVVHAQPELRQQYTDAFAALGRDEPSELLLLSEKEAITYGA